MQLSELQLECQKLGADKSLSTGCIIQRYVGKFDTFIYIEDYGSYTEYGVLGGKYNKFYKIKTDPIEFGNTITIIGHPIRYDRLCYLVMIGVEDHYEECNGDIEIRVKIQKQFNENIELYNQSILERPEKLQLLVRDFLLSIQ